MTVRDHNLHVFNTLGRRRERFEPVAPPHVGMYVCGPTVYGDAHIGHAKSYVAFDVILRYLRYLGYEVTYVQNITDVGHLTDDADEGEDKVEMAARARRVHPMQIAEDYTRRYFEDMDRLNVLRPDISPRASGHIIEQIEHVRRLIEAGHAYEVGGNVYFDVASWERYGRLSGRSVEEMQAGARVQTNPEKRHPADFALWKRAEPGHILQWPSPWGMGYPGWHIECTVMAQKYLGETVDIHGGGIENQFPHHENEIAQAEAATDQPFQHGDRGRSEDGQEPRQCSHAARGVRAVGPDGPPPLPPPNPLPQPDGFFGGGHRGGEEWLRAACGVRVDDAQTGGNRSGKRCW